jgi:hypothetical protein
VSRFDRLPTTHNTKTFFSLFSLLFKTCSSAAQDTAASIPFSHTLLTLKHHPTTFVLKTRLLQMSQLRQRSVAATIMTENSEEKDEFLLKSGAGLSAPAMLDAAPQYHGVVLKLHISLFYTILPDFLKRLILSWSFLSSFLGPSWKQRYLVICGSYLYKFKNEASAVPKGSPFEVQSLDVDVSGNEAFSEISQIPPGFSTVFCVSTLRRKHYYAVADKDEALIWVRSLQEARQESITRNMGHASHIPYPKSWSYFDSLGRNLIQSKERIRKSLEGSRLREMEMTSFADGGPLPRGYHG